MRSSVVASKIVAETHSATVTGWPATIIILVIVAIFISGIVSIFRWLKNRVK